MTTIGNFQTTGIGSLPHHNIDAALEFSFRMGIPFLPQIPIRNPWEFMIAQALEGLPGLELEQGGSVVLDLDVWMGRSRAFNDRLLNAFASMGDPDAFEGFEPSTATSSSWQPFLWELQEREAKLAKIQLAGPLTSQWVLRLKDQSNISLVPELMTQIVRLVLARALGMTRRLRNSGIQPVLFLDEPGLFGFTKENPLYALGFQELKILIQALRNEGVIVGLHCCSNTDWGEVLGLDLNFLSIDVGLSLRNLLAQKVKLESFLERGGRLSLGIIPTSGLSHRELRSLDSTEIFASLLETLTRAWDGSPLQVSHLLKSAIYTPACGLALHSTEDAEVVLSHLFEFVHLASHAIKRST